MSKNHKIGFDEYFKQILQKQNITSESDIDIDSDDLHKQKESYDEEFKKINLIDTEKIQFEKII